MNDHGTSKQHLKLKLPTTRNLLASPLRRPKKLKRSPQSPPRGSLAVAFGIVASFFLKVEDIARPAS